MGFDSWDGWVEAKGGGGEVEAEGPSALKQNRGTSVGSVQGPRWVTAQNVPLMPAVQSGW